VSHTVLVQTNVPAAVVHVPLSVGLVWGASVGTLLPLANVGVHWLPEMLHHLPAPQIASFEQPMVVKIFEPTSVVS
jgi:hypothetical protein